MKNMNIYEKLWKIIKIDVFKKLLHGIHDLLVMVSIIYNIVS